MLGSLLSGGLGPALLGVGTLLQMRAMNNARRSRQAANRAFADQQRRYSDESNQLFQESLERSNIDRTQETMDEAAGRRVQDYTDFAATDTFDPIIPGQENAPRVVGADAARQLGDELRRVEDRIRAQARLYGFGDRNLGRGIELQRTNEQQQNLGLYSRGARLARDARAAAADANGGSLLGDLLVGGGAIANAYQ